MSHSLLNFIVIIISFYEGGVTDKEIWKFTRKFIKNHHMLMTSLVKHTPPPSFTHPETSRIYLTTPHSPSS